MYEDRINYPNGDIGGSCVTQTPFECWDICKKTVDCIAIAWGNSNNTYAAKSCWIKNILNQRTVDMKWISIKYKSFKGTQKRVDKTM